MDSIIFELRFLRKMTLAPTENNRVDLYSSYMDTDLCGMDKAMFQRKRDMLARITSRTRNALISSCTVDVARSLFRWDQNLNPYQNITNEQCMFLMEMMNLLLVHSMSFEGETRTCVFIKLLVQLLMFLLSSNKKLECEHWIREHMSELISIRTYFGNSILHTALDERVGRFRLPREPIVRLLVEAGKMDVNVENRWRETPLHFHSDMNSRDQEPRVKQDTIKVAELLIENGAHMDSRNVHGVEASWLFSDKYPCWSFNFNLKCLAAKAILKHGISYEEYVADDMIPFIETHKAKREVLIVNQSTNNVDTTE